MDNFYTLALGSSAAVPTAERACSSQLVSCNNRLVLIDCGEGTQTQLRRFGASIQRINYILITHLHGDHFFGLPGLLSTMSLLGRTTGIHLMAPPALLDILKTVLRASETRLSFNFEFIALVPNVKQIVFEDEAMKISAFPLDHRIQTFGFSIEEKFQRLKINKSAVLNDNLSNEHIKLLSQGKDFQKLDGNWIRVCDYTLPHPSARKFSYCSDTKQFEKLAEYIEGTSTLYHEATFLSDRKERAFETFHSTAEEAAQLALKIGAKKLLMGHFSSRYTSMQAHIEEAQQYFPAVQCVEDGTSYPIL